MPIFRKKNILLYYAHVPKAGGTSVADFLRDHVDAEAFVFAHHWKQRPRDRWSSTSPQHIDAKSLKELFPPDFFDSAFAIVRHPEDRILSEYRFRSARSKIHAALPIAEWLRVVLNATEENPFVFDGHLRPQTDFIPDFAKVFRLEDQMTDWLSWVSALLQIEEAPGHFDHHSNRSDDRSITLCRDDRALINAFYQQDFDAFGYEARSPENLPSLAFTRRCSAMLASTAGWAVTRLLSRRIPY